MSFNIKNYNNKLLFIPLGGCNEIGINVNLYHYNGKWIMIDCGSGFADEYLPGVEMVVADIDFIIKHKADLLGIVLTHAHEDHLGGIQYLWNELQCPIFATKFTANFLSIRMKEYNFAKNMQIKVIDPNKTLNLHPFSLDFIGLTHSAPEMHAIMVSTKAGNVLHTGDWKFDNDPVVGKKSDEELLKQCGDKGVLALVCDSTNVFNKGWSDSEGDLRKSLVDIIARCPKMVVVATFASNIARLDTLIYAGQKAGRKVAIVGRSLKRMLTAAQESGYLNDILPIIDEDSISKYKKEEILIIATGCQGEALAAVNKIAQNNHLNIKLGKKDTIIFSSKIIPGNEKKIFRLFNTFVKLGVEVITERDHFVHVSGHPYVEELKRMYELVRPKVCIPVHGEPVHLHEHAKLAISCGIPKAIEVENGSVVLLEDGSSSIIGKVNSGYLAIDGNYLIPTTSNILKTRRKIKEDGVVVATIVVDSNSNIISSPVISAPGVLDDKEDMDMIKLIRDDISEHLSSISKVHGKMSIDQIKEHMQKTIRKLIKSEINKNPLVITNVIKLNK